LPRKVGGHDPPPSSYGSAAPADPTVKKLKICLFVLTQCTNVTDGETRHRMTECAALMHSILRQKLWQPFP